MCYAMLFIPTRLICIMISRRLISGIDVAYFVAKCMECKQVKDEHMRPERLNQEIDFPKGKW